MAKTLYASVPEYIAAQPRDSQTLLKRVRATLRKALPGAEETISYQIPTYKLDGRPVIYFAGWKTYYSLYPVGESLLAQVKAVGQYEVRKGTLRLPLSEPVPDQLIARLAKARAEQLVVAPAAKRQRPGTKAPVKKRGVVKPKRTARKTKSRAP